MSEPIKVGDLVVVVRWTPGCRHAGNHVGKVGRVLSINNNGIKCNCGAWWLQPGMPSADTDIIDDGGHWPLSWLKRIDPLTELEGTDTDVGVPVQRRVTERIET